MRLKSKIASKRIDDKFIAQNLGDKLNTTRQTQKMDRVEKVITHENDEDDFLKIKKKDVQLEID